MKRIFLFLVTNLAVLALLLVIFIMQMIQAPHSGLESRLIATVKRLAGEAQVGMPEVGIFDAAKMNAFATGARHNSALVAVSSGLLRGMQRPQIQAVLGHEISHVEW